MHAMPPCPLWRWRHKSRCKGGNGRGPQEMMGDKLSQILPSKEYEKANRRKTNNSSHAPIPPSSIRVSAICCDIFVIPSPTYIWILQVCICGVCRAKSCPECARAERKCPSWTQPQGTSLFMFGFLGTRCRDMKICYGILRVSIGSVPCSRCPDLSPLVVGGQSRQQQQNPVCFCQFGV